MAGLNKASMAKVKDAAAGKTCRCGHSVDHVMVSPEPEYNGWGQFWSLFMGVSTAPIKLTFTCRVCKGVLYTTKDSTVLERFI